MSQSDGSAELHTPEKNDRRIGENSKNIAELANRVNDLEEIVEKQADIIEDLRAGTTADDYQAMTAKEREQKVAAALRKKASGTGRSAMDYSEIVALFEHELPNPTAYKLMKRLDNRDGYAYEERDGANNRVTFDREKTDRVFTSE